MSNFYLGLLKHPIATLRLVNYTRVKNYFVTILFASGDEKERIFGHYRNLITDDSGDQNASTVTDYEQVKRFIPTFDKIDVSIIIPAYNQWTLTDNCLRSVISSVKNVAYEIILADDCSTDETINASQVYANLKIVRPESNLGFVLNCNNASKHASGKYIVLLNNDTEVHAFWLEALFQKMEKDKKIAICGSKLLYPDGKLQEAGGIIWNDASGWNYGRLDSPDKPQYSYCKDVDYVSGASIMIRQSFWAEVGGFDEQYCPAYYEDTDLAFTAKSKGLRVVFHPHSVVTHFEGQSHGTDESTGIKAYQLENRKKFARKWADTLAAEHMPNAQDVFHARDCSSGKRTILIVDHYVPWFDKDAGSRSLFMYMESFIESGYNVKFLGDNFFAHQPYTDALNELGVEVLHGTYYAQNWKKWIIENSKSIDVAYLHRPHIASKYIDFLAQHTEAKIVYQCVDLHHIRVRRDFDNSGDFLLASEADRWEKIERELFDKADIGLTFSTTEKEYLESRDICSTVYQVPLYLYDDNEPDPPGFDQRADLLFVAGFSHKPNIEGILWFCENVWPSIQARHPGLVLQIVGSNMPRAVRGLASPGINILGFVSDDVLASLYKKSRVSILPLLHGAGVKGKLIESMLYGTPIVSTPVGLEGVNARSYGLAGMETAEQFAEEVCRLLESKEYWRQIQKALEQAFSSNFSKSRFKTMCKEIF